MRSITSQTKELLLIPGYEHVSARKAAPEGARSYILDCRGDRLIVRYFWNQHGIYRLESQHKQKVKRIYESIITQY